MSAIYALRYGAARSNRTIAGARMDAWQCARASARAIAELGGRFMVEPSTFAKGNELGFPGMTFYVAGRGGALGDVHGDVVAASFVFFEPGLIRTAWDSTADVMSRRAAADAFASCLHEWARARIAAGPDAERLADLAGRVVAAANPAGAPLFGAWRAVPEPADAPALAAHRMHVLRELRGGHHGGAVLAAGLTPLEAQQIATPQWSPTFGWSEPYPDVTALRDRWEQAEEATDLALSRCLEVLAPDERADFATLATAIDTAAAART